MGLIASFTVDGGEKVQVSMAALTKKAQDLRPFWRDVFAPRFFAGVQALFESGGRGRASTGRFSGGAWAPLTPVYKQWKAKHYPNKKILQRTGELQDSMVWTGTDVGPGGIFQTTANYVKVGTSVPYGVFHQKGTSKMVARPFLVPPDPKVFAPLLKQWLLKNDMAAGASQAPDAGSGSGE